MPVNTIEPPDSHHLRAAQGWIELSDFDEAANDLAKIRPQFRNLPAVSEVRWVLAANAHQWPKALSLAKKIARLTPDNAEGWMYEARSLIELRRPSEAYSLLLEAQQRFPGDEVIVYDLGCVCCTLGRPNEAFSWVGKAIRLGGIQMELRAIGDPELRALWKDLRRNRRRPSA